MLYHVYIIYSEHSDKFYVGSTSDVLIERIRRHNSIHRGFTGRSNDWKLVYGEKYYDKSMAIRREKEINHGKAGKEHNC